MFSVSAEEQLQQYPGLFLQHTRYPQHYHYPGEDHGLVMAYHSIADIQPGGGGGGGGGSGGVGGGRPGGFSMSEFSYTDYTSSSSSRRERRQSLLVVVTFVVEVVLLVAVVVIEYFLRWTDVFPVRRQNFTCNDVSIACTSRDKELMSEFAFGGKVPDTVIYCLTFCIPPLVVGVGEVGLYAMSSTAQRRILRVVDTFCSVPHIIRRLFRFLGVFLFGAFAMMVFSDVTRNLIGRLRPDFLETCDVNMTLCSQSSSLDDSACLNTDVMQMRYARTSFPSVHSALSSYAAVFVAVYIHGAWRCHAVRIARVFLALSCLLLAGMEALSEYCTCLSHWTDVAVGLVAGIAMALYLTVYVVNCFQDEVTQAEIQHMLRVFLDDVYWTYGDKSHLARPSDQHLSHTLPRIPSLPESPPPTTTPTAPSAPPAHSPPLASSPPSRGGGGIGGRFRQARQRLRPFTMFQRDLSETVEQHHHRRHTQSEEAAEAVPSHM